MTKLTVLMTVYNGETYLRETMESILNQTYRDFIFLIIDNASTDGSREIIRSYDDPRINLVPLPENIGQVGALNKGLDMIETPYVARMDADDISLPRRFQRQVAFMDRNPETGVCGTYAIAFQGNQITRWKKTCEPAEVKANLLFGCPLAHPSVIMRTQFLNKHNLRYNEEIGFSEDWDLWLRAGRCFPIANIPEYLLRYRIHGGSVSSRNLEPQQKVDRMLSRRLLEELELAEHPMAHIHEDVSRGTTSNFAAREPGFLDQVLLWFDELRTANRRTGIYGAEALEKEFRRSLFRILRANPQWKGLALKTFFKQGVYRSAGFVPSLKLIGKILLSR